MEFSKNLFIYLLLINLFSTCFTSKFLASPVEDLSNNSTKIPEDIQTILTILKGFANTSGIYDNLPSVQNITKEEYHIVLEFIDAFKIFENITKDNYVDVVMTGSQILSKSFKKVADFIPDSLQLGRELKTLALEILKKLADKHYYINLLMNLVSYNIFEIFEVAQKIDYDRGTKNYSDLGLDMGKMFRILFVIDMEK